MGRKCEQPPAAPRACRHNGASMSASMPSSSPASPDSHTLRLVLILGLLSAIGPFAIDMYLPALPQIGSSLGAQVGAVQASLTAFFLSLGVGQLLYGPVSDIDRKSTRLNSSHL